MKCPKCENSSLVNSELEEKLSVQSCGKCEGIWIPAKNYWDWLKEHGEKQPEKPESETASLEVHENNEIKICPDCGHFLIKRKVGHGIEFHIDRCTICGGIWLDDNEWNILKSRNLHDAIHQVFSVSWQEGIVKDEQEKFYKRQAQKTLGENDFQKIADFKKWVEKHPRKGFIFAYLKRPKV